MDHEKMRRTFTSTVAWNGKINFCSWGANDLALKELLTSDEGKESGVPDLNHPKLRFTSRRTVWPPNLRTGEVSNSRIQRRVAGSCPRCTSFACSTYVLSKDSMPSCGLFLKHVKTIIHNPHISFIHYFHLFPIQTGHTLWSSNIAGWEIPLNGAF